MNNANQSSANQGPRDATMAGGYPPRYDARRNANAPGRANTSAVLSPYQQSYGARTRDPLDNVIRGLVDEAPPYAVLGASSTAPDLRTFIMQQLSNLKQDLRRELEEMKKAIQDDVNASLEYESGENEAKLKAELKRLRGSIIDEVRNAIEANATSMDEELPNKIEELLSVRFDEIQDKLEGQGLLMDKVIRKVSAVKDQLDEGSGYMRERGDVLLDANKASMAHQDRLAAWLKKFEDGAAGQAQPQGGHRAVAEASAASSSHQAIQQEAATTSMGQIKQSSSTSNAAATTTSGGPASFTLSATASSLSFSMNTAGSPSANDTTPTASLAQYRKTRQIIHDNNDDASGSAMPPAKRPRAEEVPKGQGGSRGSSSASETLTGDDEDEEGTGQ